jgi:hypothetical protein
MAICPQTRLTIPECSCDRCVEEQIRRFMPVLLEREAQLPAAASNSPDSRRPHWQAAA